MAILSLLSDTASLLFGLSYYSGKFIISFVLSALTFLWELSGSLGTSAHEVVLWIADFEKEVAKAVLLIFYGIGQIGEAFVITFTDLYSVAIGTCTSIATLVSHLITTLSTLAILAIATVPSQLLSFVVLLGDSFYDICASCLSLFKTVFVRLPIQGTFALATLAKGLFTLPGRIFLAIPARGYLGILVLFFLYFVYCRFSLRRFMGGIGMVGRWILGGFKYLSGIFSAGRGSGIYPDQSAAAGGRSSGGDGDKRAICVVCREAEVAFMASPCSHVALCKDCCHELSRNGNRCPICRNTVRKYSRVYIP